MASTGVNHLSQPCVYGYLVSSSAERKSWFMKWLSKIFISGGGGSSNRGSTGRGQHLQLLEDENMVWRDPSRSMDDDHNSAREQEEVDQALASSSARDSTGRYGWREGNDDYLARDLQDTGNISSFPPPLAPFYPPYVSAPYYPRGYRICGGCNYDIGYGNYLGCMGTYFHPRCFRCRSCGYPITEHEFSLSGKDPYHKSCYKELTHPKCEVCHRFIPINASGLIEYRCHPFWSQKYCPSHEYDSTARCCSCERLESWSARYVSLDDGRSICLECMESAIMDTGDCQPLYHSIRDFYEGMYMKIDQQIPMLLVERQALNDAIVGEKHGIHQLPETRGLCLSEEQTITSILKRSRMGHHRLGGMRTHREKLTRKCEVTAILVLYGLPRLLTGAILAHELMHGWLRLKGYRNLSIEVEEGICQVLGYMWLESEVMPGFRSGSSTSMMGGGGASSSSTSSIPSSSSCKKGQKSEAEMKLGEFFLHQIAHDTSPAYGGGFRAANAAVNKYGLRRTLDHILYTGGFPL